MKFIYSLLFCIPTLMYAQIGIGTSTPAKNAILEVESADKGVLFPRLTQLERDAITSPKEGLVIFCTNCCVEPSLFYYNGTDWVEMVANCIPLPPIVETNFSLVAGSDPNHLTSSEMPFLFDGDTLPPAGITNMNLHTFNPNNPHPNAIELVSQDTFPIGTKISVYWYNSITESDHLELSFSMDGGATYTNEISSQNSALAGVTYVFTVFSPVEFTAFRLKGTMPTNISEQFEPYINEILVNDGLTTITFQ